MVGMTNLAVLGGRELEHVVVGATNSRVATESELRRLHLHRERRRLSDHRNKCRFTNFALREIGAENESRDQR